MELKEAVEYKGDSKVEATIETVDVDQVKKVQVKRKSYWSRAIEEAGTDEGVEKKKGFQEKLIKTLRWETSWRMRNRILMTKYQYC